MSKMNLYISGIFYGTVDFSEKETKVALLDPFEGTIQPEQTVDEDLAKQLRMLTRLDFSSLGERLKEASEPVASGQETFTLSDGALYEKKDEHHYIQKKVMYPADLICQESRIVGVQTCGREKLCTLVEPEWKVLTFVPQWEELYPDAPYAVAEVQTERIPMRDGIHLAADIWLPKNISSPLPCVLVRTPYGRQASAENYRCFVQRGFAVVIQDTRGRNDSEGDWEPMTCETEDGSDTLDWIAAQPWCTGAIGMIGGSYLGYVQWAAAASGNPHLKALVSEVTAGSAFIDMPRRGGTFSSGTLAWAFAVSKRKMDPSLMVRDDWDEILEHRPLTDVCSKALGYEIPFWNQWLSHPCDDAYWAKGNWYQRALEKKIQVPALIMSGWFDDNGMGTTQALALTKDYPAGMRKVILGPWKHAGNANYELHGVEMGSNALRYDLDLLYYKWFEHHLRGMENGIEKTAPVEYFTVGENRWKEAKHWPPEYTKETVLYLDGENTLTSKGTGRLSSACPTEEVTDGFLYDPANPAIHIIDMSENEVEVPENYTEQELRSDYLCYTTAPMEKPLVITGDATVELYLSSDVPDTDLVVRLTKVDAKGQSIKLADGVFDVKFREGFDHEAFMEPGKIYPVSILTTKISACFAPGERLRLDVTSSAKNMIFPNSNTKEGYLGTESAKANNVIHHGGNYPSRIILRQEV